MVLIIDVLVVLVFIIFDEIYKIVVICFDDCICVGGMVEIVGYDMVLKVKCCVMLELVVNDLFFGVGDMK